MYQKTGVNAIHFTIVDQFLQKWIIRLQKWILKVYHFRIPLWVRVVRKVQPKMSRYCVQIISFIIDTLLCP